MKRAAFILLSIILLGCFVFTAAKGQGRVPQFRDYPVAEAYIGPNAPLVLTRSERMFRTRLREAAREKPNFAGRYILTTWGCGTTCLMGAAIDAKTGRVYWLPGTICCANPETYTDENFEPVIARLNSKLLVLSGMINERESTQGTHFYKFENGRFTLIRTVKK